MLRRAVSNLLSNALRHTPEGGTVQVELHAHAQHVRLSVHNTGPNIPAEVLPRLFDRFYRADPARVHSVSDGLTGVGVGLGLAITQAIAHAHGGCISVRSQGGMTSFDLDIPVP
jgi:two-component system heavy metal sensor histidine kinase CusS